MTITVRPDGQRFRLWVHDNRMGPMPAGDRLFRAPPIPDIKFDHALLADAERDAAKLRTYMATTGGKIQSKKEIRSQTT